MVRLTQADLQEMNEVFEQRTPQELLRWTQVVFGDRVAALSAMQKAGSVVCHMLRELNLPIKILFVDTGVHFPETLQHARPHCREYNLEIETLLPTLTMDEQTSRYGVLYLSSEGQERCCHMRKTEPLLGVKGQYDALIGSLMRAEGGRTTEGSHPCRRPGNELPARESAGRLFRSANGRLYRCQ